MKFFFPCYMPFPSYNKSSREAGFTLLELSIVLVVIALIVGGVLVGQNLIKSAEIRGTVGQFEKYNSAVNTFRVKYGGLPGDIRKTEAAAFGLYSLVMASAVGFGDGNGLIEGGNSGSALPVGETLLFWRHMSDAGLVDGALGVVGNSIIVTGTGLVTGAVSNISQSLPPTKVSAQNAFVVFSANGFNYYTLVPITAIDATPAYTMGNTGISPIAAYNIDAKIDDGNPNTGIIIARGITAINIAPSVAIGPALNTCTTGTGSATDTYNRMLNLGQDDPSCGMRARFQ